MKWQLLTARTMLLCAALSGAACMTLEQAAPLSETLPMAARTGPSSQLVLGRDLYVTKCAKCHSVEPVKKYPLEQWEREILPEMIEETNLSPEEGAAVRSYVLAVLKS